MGDRAQTARDVRRQAAIAAVTCADHAADVRCRSVNVSSPWVGRIFLCPGRLTYAGAVGPTAAHAHHAFQVIVGVSGPLALADGHGQTVEARAAVIPPDTLHAVTRPAAAACILYVDPDDLAGRRLRRGFGPAPASRAWLDAATPLLGVDTRVPSRWSEVQSFEQDVLQALGVPALRPRPQHPAVARALRTIADGAAAELSHGAIAAACGLSPGRLSHVFSRDVGIPLRRYLLWRRIIRAGSEIAAGASLTRAALAAGFADSAHMSHVFRRMFGLAPRDVHRGVEWLVEGLAPAQ